MTYFKPVAYHEIPDAVARHEAAMLDRMFEDQYRQEVEAEMADEEFGPGWEEMSLDPEDRRLISEADVEDAEWPTVRADLTYIPGSDE
jgi:hypothetical protein